MSNHEGTLPFRRVRSAPSSLGALTYQPEAQAPTERNIVEEPRAQGEAEEDISDPSTPISVFSAQEEVEEDNSNPSSPLSAFSAQEEAEEDSSDPSSPLSVFSAQEEVEEDNSNPSSPLFTFSAQEEQYANTSSPLSVFSAQEEVEEDNTDPSSPLSVTLPPEVQPPPQPDIISEDEIGPASPSPQQVPRTPSIPSPQPPPQPDIISEDEIGPATPSPPQVPRTPSIPSPQPIPSSKNTKYSRSLDLFTIFAALVIGYATSVIGGIISMNLFLNDLSHTIYVKAMKTYENDFCVYRNGLLLLLGASIGLSSLISLFIALMAYVK
ncbi:hypothetical protein LguiA_005114 [Lonicera macranthoides]